MICSPLVPKILPLYSPPRFFSLLTHTLLIFIIKYPSFYISSASFFLFLFLFFFNFGLFSSLEYHTDFNIYFSFWFVFYKAIVNCTQWLLFNKFGLKCIFLVFFFFEGLPLVLVWHKLETNVINIWIYGFCILNV